MTKSVQGTILLGQFFMILALEMTNPFLPLLIASQSNAPMEHVVFYSTLCLLLPMIANILVAPVWGMAADRYGYKPMLMRASWALVVTQASMIFVDSVTWILVIRILQGAFAGFIIAMQTYAVSICDWQSKGRQLSRLQSTKAMATALAGFIGGVALAFTDYQGLYGAASLICLFITLMMQIRLPPSSKNNVRQSIPKASSSSGSRSIFYFLCVLISLTQIAKFLPDPGFTLYLNGYFPDNLMMIGLLYSMPAAGMLCSSEWCGRQFDRCRNYPEQVNLFLIRYSVLGLSLMLLQAFTSNFAIFVVLRILWGVVLAALLPALFALCSDRNVLPGYALGIANSFAKTGNLIGLLLGGLLAGCISYPLIFLVIAALYGLFAVLVLAYHVMYPIKIKDVSHLYGDATS
ncbi:MFS transporter [Legionella bononiensis]|uniref:MFS transporter n=1 Tax=Legionella bononiensis TaxID=2793102 RepID=A0ABS1W6S9_9GAMM|nr:MFS transporter [Legionella bononiensis]MBL7478442.1 MFS transporter [Legionella bononiensis]MBL7525039.1 MFS transporter [Legionella bononiensis]MBL7561335.1 MFS transporter [Legionella bononiensis]